MEAKVKEALERLRPMFDEERDLAWDEAAVALAGPEIDRKEFMRNRDSRYPWQVWAIAIFFALTLIIAAYMPSSHRIYLAGAIHFCDTWEAGAWDASSQFPRTCQAAGIANVILAETGQISFLVILAIFGSSGVLDKFTIWIFRAGVIITLMIAIVSNWEIVKPDQHGFKLMYLLETLAPTFVVTGLGYALKTYVLDAISQRHVALNEYKRAVAHRAAILKDPESHDFEAFSREFSKAIRNKFRRIHARDRVLLNSLDGQAWRAIILREMKLNQFTVIPKPGELTEAPVQAQIAATATQAPHELTPREMFDVWLDAATSRWKVRYKGGVTIPGDYATENRAYSYAHIYHKKQLATEGQAQVSA